jgi:hypothetical protein
VQILLQDKYNIYFTEDGGWTTWGEWGECSRTCGGGWRRRERNFTNPEPNYFSAREVYEDNIYYDMERCKTQDCPCMYTCDISQWLHQVMVMVNATVNNISIISWWSVLLVEETRVPGDNH